MFGWGKKQEQLDALFAQYVRPEVVEAMKSPDFNPELNNLSEANVNFILMTVSGATPNEVGRNLGKVAEVTTACGWYLDCIFSNLAVAIDGPIPMTASPVSTRSALLKRLQEVLGDQLKTVHGRQDTPWGSYGSPHRRAFGAMLPGFVELVAQLHAQPYGSHVERAAR
ncbi:MAG: hypothetical protein WA373_10265 [Burkholderiales bacterium]